MTIEIIAEIGVNHNGQLDIAERLIWGAKAAGADTCKFQLTCPELETSGRHAPEHLQMIRDTGAGDILLLEAMRAICLKAGMRFLCTPAEESSLAVLVRMGADRIKIGSDNLANPPFLRACRATKLPLILSTGMARMVEVRRAMLAGRLAGADLTLLHCVSRYPCPAASMNLPRIKTLRDAFLYPVGLSDHCDSALIPALAVAIGAVVIEKHLTLDRSMSGPDHSSSLDPRGFDDMVRLVRMTEKAMEFRGSGPQPEELETARVVGKSLVAARAIMAGESFRADNVALKRPGTGMSPWKYDALLCIAASQDYETDEQIDEAVL